MSDLKDALAVLELPPKTTRSEVKKSYRTLLKVWHPDRFTGDPEMQATAEERTKRITVAYGTVMDYLKTGQGATQTGPSADEARQREHEAQRSQRERAEQAAAAERQRSERQVNTRAKNVDAAQDVDSTQAVTQLRWEAEQGGAQPQLDRGVMYSIGRGVAQDEKKALKWFRRAVEQGEPRVDAKAATCFRREAEEGNVCAQFYLGRMHREGRGVPLDYVKAYLWLEIAATQWSGDLRDRAITIRDFTARDMSAGQLAEARRRVSEWQAAHPREP